MNEKPPNTTSLFLNEEADKPPLPKRGLWRRLRRAMQKKAACTKDRMSTITKENVKGFLRRNLFVLLTIAAVALGKWTRYSLTVLLGVMLGFALRPHNLTLREIKYFAFPGELLMRMLQMLVLPLIISSLVTGISSLDSKASGKMGMRAVVYYMVTTLIAVFIGIVIVIVIKPGKGHRDSPVASSGTIEPVQAADAFLDLIRNMFPPNLVEACFKQYKTVYKKTIHTKNVTVAPSLTDSLNTTEAALAVNMSRVLQTIQETVVEMIPVSGSSNGVNALGLVVFSMCFGLVIGSMKQQGQALRDFFDCLNEAIMRLVAIIIWLVVRSSKIVEMKNLAEVGGQLGMYTVSVIVGLLIHGLFVLPLLYFLVTRKNPYTFIAGLLQALITALGTSSSSATLPITFRCLEENNRVDKRVTRFILPVGATINMDGTALYEAVAAIFIAQYHSNSCQHRRSRHPTGWSGYHGDRIDIGGTAHRGHNADHRCGLVPELQSQDVEIGNSVIEENEKPYRLICQENDSVKHRNSETPM
ncbi:unnamed protein product [Coregonus sp. 'balchen']|nr:unnamed protein product [Coregonus sp. 'balchen']